MRIDEKSMKYIIRMQDGGKCNLYFIINLTKNKVELFNIAGVP